MLMLPEIRNESGCPVFLVLFSLGLSNKGGVQLWTARAMKRCCECHLPKYRRVGGDRREPKQRSDLCSLPYGHQTGALEGTH